MVQEAWTLQIATEGFRQGRQGVIIHFVQKRQRNGLWKKKKEKERKGESKEEVESGKYLNATFYLEFAPESTWTMQVLARTRV